ncbi:hypothetical protein [uncultured Sphingomonas sp.]|uniref:hypothetical protein n=1 Tax=uncultured Sphingomonas sp. TaxID=158754 RepID=UPI0026110D9E|nr:hypothetical protein [uncultured Sphingomonas sp.]
MKMRARAACLLSAFVAWAPSLAQHATASAAPAGYAPEQAVVTVPAYSIGQEGVVTSTAATPTSGGAAFASGAAVVGPFAPQLGRDIRVVLKGTWAGGFVVGTSTSANACAAGTINPLTVAGQPWGNFSANANEVVDTPTLAGIVYCATATVTSGSLSYSLRQ